jgi:hypothetical protein
MGEGLSNFEIAGHLSIFISMIFVFMGIKHYRDSMNGGKLNFAQGLKVGTLIILIPAIAFGLLDIVYTEFKAQREMFSSPILQFMIMPMTVFVL